MDRKISIIVPAYNEEASLDELYERLIASFNTMKEKGQVSSYEIWFINDGSKDNTEGKIEELISKDKNVHLISFRKNFGKNKYRNCFLMKMRGFIIAFLADQEDIFRHLLLKSFQKYFLIKSQMIPTLMQK